MRSDFYTFYLYFKNAKILEKELAELFSSYGLSFSEFGTLEALKAFKKSSVQMVAKRILITSGTITHTINSLLKKGLITRQMSAKDNRVFCLLLTQKGTELIDELMMKHDEVTSKFFEPLSGQERVDLFSLLKKIYKNKEKK